MSEINETISNLSTLAGCRYAVYEMRREIEADIKQGGEHGVELSASADAMADRISNCAWQPHTRQQATEIAGEARLLARRAWENRA